MDHNGRVRPGRRDVGHGPEARCLALAPLPHHHQGPRISKGETETDRRREE